MFPQKREEESLYAVCEGHLKRQFQKKCVPAIMNMNHTSTKNAEIKIRIRKEDKTRLQEMAKKQNMTLSDYMLTKCFSGTDKYTRMIPDAVETWNTYNQILHTMKNTDDEHLKTNVESIINHALQKTRFQKGEMNHEQD